MQSLTVLDAAGREALNKPLRPGPASSAAPCVPMVPPLPQRRQAIASATVLVRVRPRFGLPPRAVAAGVKARARTRLRRNAAYAYGSVHAVARRWRTSSAGAPLGPCPCAPAARTYTTARAHPHGRHATRTARVPGRGARHAAATAASSIIPAGQQVACLYCCRGRARLRLIGHDSFFLTLN